QLIEQRAIEDAAKMVEIAALIQTPPGSQLRSSTRQQPPSIMPNGSRPPPIASMTGLGGANGPLSAGQPVGAQRMVLNGVSANPSPAQLLAARVQPVVPPANQMQQQQQKLAQQQQQQQSQMRQQQRQQQQLQQQLQPLAYNDSAPQLPKDIVDLFPTADGRIKWFATVPVCRIAEPSVVRHSAAYTKWKQSQASSLTM
ncbi:hypothetical protein GGI17_006669, partial [Coemansia sp. S146]